MNVWFAGGGTGGHLYPGLAIAHALINADPRVKPFFIGARRGIERDVLPGTEFPFELLDLHPLYRSQPWKNWKTVVGGVGAWRRVSTIARERGPLALVATGGYAAGVALGYAATAGIPIVIQEQNSYPGITVRRFAARARQIHLGFPEAAAFLRRGRFTEVFDSGNPIEPPPLVRPSRDEIDSTWGFEASSRKTMLVFGGSQGAQAINRVIGKWIENGGPDNCLVRVVWSTGKSEFPLYAHFESPAVRVRPYITPMANAYTAADFAVCRSGAMATAELSAWGIPAVLVPLPTAAADHQTANARAIASAGAAIMIAQHDFSVATLDATVRRLAGSVDLLDTMRGITLQRARSHAAEDIANKILSLIT